MPILLLILFVLSLPFTYTLDPDFGWHLYLGQYMHSAHALVHTLVGYTQFAGQQVIDHEWLSHWLLYPLYQHFGYWPFILLTLLVMSGAIALVYYDARRRGSVYPYVLIAFLMFFLGLSYTYRVSLQILLFLGAALLVWLAHYGPRSWRRFLGYFLLFLIGNNLHGGFVLLLPIPVFLELKPFSKEGWWRNSLLALGVSLLALLITPYGWHFWQTSWDYFRDPVYKVGLSEWHSVFSYPIQWIKILFPLIFTGWIFTIKRFWRTLPLGELFMLILYGYLGLRYQRFFPFFLLLTVPAAAQGWQQFLSLRTSSQKIVERALIIFSVIVLIVLSVHEYPYVRWQVKPEQAAGYPQRAIARLDSQAQCIGHTLNNYDWGGYLLSFSTQPTVFIDGRAPQERIDGSTLLTIYSSFFSYNQATIAAVLKKYQIRCILMSQAPTLHLTKIDQLLFGEQGIQQNAPTQNLINYLQSQAEWHRAYQDPLAILFVN